MANWKAEGQAAVIQRKRTRGNEKSTPERKAQVQSLTLSDSYKIHYLRLSHSCLPYKCVSGTRCYLKCVILLPQFSTQTCRRVQNWTVQHAMTILPPKSNGTLLIKNELISLFFDEWNTVYNLSINCNSFVAKNF